jgi:hypothetical protein
MFSVSTVGSCAPGPLRTLTGRLDETDARALKRDFVTFHEGFAIDLGVCAPRDYLVTAGTRR